MNPYTHDVTAYMTVAKEVMFTQMSAKSGIYFFCERSIADMFRESKKLNGGKITGKPDFGTINTDRLTISKK